MRFVPTAVGAVSRTLSFTGGGGGSVSLSGTGASATATATPILSVTPASLAFGSVKVGYPKDLTITVRNAGGGTLTGSASTLKPFHVGSNGSYTLAANQTKVLTVRFVPTAVGAVSRTLSFTGGGGGSVSLSGTGSHLEKRVPASAQCPPATPDRCLTMSPTTAFASPNSM